MKGIRQFDDHSAGLHLLNIVILRSLCVAQMYRAGQKRIAQKALAALSQEASGLLREIQHKCQHLQAADTGTLEQSRAAPGTESTAEASGTFAPLIAEPPSTSSPRNGAGQSSSPLKVLHGEAVWQGGVTIAQSFAEGEVLARQPLCLGFSAASNREFVMDLAAARCRISQSDKAGESDDSQASPQQVVI